jgi:hypothetical protein
MEWMPDGAFCFHSDASGPAPLIASVGSIENMEHLFNHLIQRHLVPVLLLPVVLSGLCCFGILLLPEAFRGSSTDDRIIAVICSLIGIFGTVATLILLRAIRRRPTSWRVFELGRTAWTVLVSIAWLAGVACGFIMLHGISR